MQPDLDATREFWLPTMDQCAALTAMGNEAQRNAEKRAMFLAW